MGSEKSSERQTAAKGELVMMEHSELRKMAREIIFSGPVVLGPCCG
jgi:hypothetical protein